MKTTPELSLIRMIATFLPSQHRADWVAEWTAELIHARRTIEQTRPLTLLERARLLKRAAGGSIDVIAVRRVQSALPRTESRYERRILESLLHDVQFATRVLARKPAFTVMAVLTLALGIGAATTIFTILDGVLLRPLAFDNAQQLVTVWQTDAKFRAQATLNRRWDKLWFSYPEYQQWRNAQRLFREVAVFGSQEMALTELGEPTEVVVYPATPTLLTVLGSKPAIGRWFSETEQGKGADRVTVISHALWAARFGSDSNAINRYVTLDDQRYRIVGVMSEDFQLPNLTSSNSGPPSFWIPIGSDGGGSNFDSSYEGIGRLRPNVTVQQAVTESNTIVASVTGNKDRGVNVVGRLQAETASAKAPLLLLTGGVVLLLAIACVNIALLLLGEIPAREREFATRVALGASRHRLIRQLLTESVVLALIGNVLGIGLAYAGVQLLIALAPDTMPRVENVRLSAKVLFLSVVLTSLVGVVFGLLPAISASHARLGESLRLASRQISRSRQRMQHVALVAQAAMALVLLSAAVTLGRSLQNLANVQPGFSADGVLTVSLTPSAVRHEKPEALNAFHVELKKRLEALPGVERVGVVSNLPLAGRNGTMNIEIEGVAYSKEVPKPNVQRRAVGSGYFDAMRIPLIKGRSIASATSGNEIVVDEAFAHRFWPNESAIEKHINAYGRQMTIIGVVGSVRHTRLDDTAQATLYFPFSSMATREVSLVVRTSNDPLNLASAVRRTIWELDPTIPLPKIASMTSYVSRSKAAETYRTTLLGFFGIAATLLTAVGVFGVTTRIVSQQRREIGIRLALGATQSSVVGLVLRHQLLCILIGVALGGLLVQFIAPLLMRFVYQVSPTDWQNLGLTIAALLTVNACGFLSPARMAFRIQPARLINDER